MRIDNISTLAGDIGLVPSSSFLAGVTPTLIQSYNVSGQSVPNNNTQIITGWTNVVAQNAGEWNASTGVFTATKAGNYFVSAAIRYSACQLAFGNEFNVAININNSPLAVSYHHSQNSTGSMVRSTGVASVLVLVAVGDTITVRSYHNQGAAVTLTNNEVWSNVVSIVEIPNRITRR